MNILLQDIQSQAHNLRRVIEHLLGPERTRLEAAAAFLQNDRPITMVGMGSAAYLCLAPEVYLNQHGRPASVVFASDAFYNLVPALKRSNVVINSRSGETHEVVQLGKALAEQGIPFLTITNEPESSLARCSSHILWTNSLKDDLVSINIVTSMLLTTTMLAAAAVGELKALEQAILRLPDQMQQVIDQSCAQAGQMADYFQGIRPLFLLYRSTLKGAAFNGQLVLEEVARTPGVAMEAGNFRQGPNEVIDERFGAVVLVPPGKQGALNLSLGRDILRLQGRVMLVGNSGEWNSGGYNLLIPDLPESLLPVLVVVPLQVLAYALAERQGYTPGAVRYISKVILSEEGIPNQT